MYASERFCYRTFGYMASVRRKGCCEAKRAVGSKNIARKMLLPLRLVHVTSLHKVDKVAGVGKETLPSALHHRLIVLAAENAGG